jgi:hypothetical protein
MRLILAFVLALAASAAHADCKIDTQCNPEKYGGSSISNSTTTYEPAPSYQYWYWWQSYRGDPVCAGLPRLEYRLCRQGRRIEGY